MNSPRLLPVVGATARDEQIAMRSVAAMKELMTEHEFFNKTVREELPEMLILAIRFGEGDMTLGELLSWRDRMESIAWCLDRVLTPDHPFYVRFTEARAQINKLKEKNAKKARQILAKQEVVPL